ncbi:MarR family winged helix-turn-helix transcriptional regulator [Chondromyces apiculatus]|uniref:Organic hydroperoxide resistance transcriptional regulator n=1 Tax=Chondromyces apiculatus DSM 436 TaxID=1192034 RepID=A0A017SV18_9BACT|nr:MarR family transcriptional regulator [Chondromyces apiculatus]EYF00582.1 Organic hydroperoxide resistance transcriptional regulator [Chondromyces apiculatus DSM 436]
MRLSSATPSSKDKDAPPRLGDVLDFMRLLWAVDHGLQSMSKRMESKIGVTGPQRLVIRIVGRYPGISAGQLAEILELHPSTLTGVLRRLQERGIVERRTDPKDGRRALFDLTARGKELDAMRVGTVEAVVRSTLKTLPRRKVEAAQEVLTILASSLGPEPDEE